ncbi:MAG: hypothetical protein HYY06_03265, partial [Deltaproteobacteria bacterium]|nr:hypothetical protein [Deltaproteobacteria bacterium]
MEEPSGADRLLGITVRRLFWGHQSVGENLIQGSSALGYSWGEASRASDYDEGTTWGHGSIGE